MHDDVLRRVTELLSPLTLCERQATIPAYLTKDPTLLADQHIQLPHETR